MAVVKPSHGYNGYSNRGCRCPICVRAQRDYMRGWKAARMAERTMVDGRLTSTTARHHGRYTTYANWGCRCQPCTTAHTRRPQRGK